jgi:hypothetical protein
LILCALMNLTVSALSIKLSISMFFRILPYSTLLFNLIFTSGHTFCWPCSRNISIIFEECNRANKVVLTRISALTWVLHKIDY